MRQGQGREVKISSARIPIDIEKKWYACIIDIICIVILCNLWYFDIDIDYLCIKYVIYYR